MTTLIKPETYNFAHYAESGASALFFAKLAKWAGTPNSLNNETGMQLHCLRAMPLLLPWSLPHTHFNEQQQARFQQLLTESLIYELESGRGSSASLLLLNHDFLSRPTYPKGVTPQQVLAYTAIVALTGHRISPVVRVNMFMAFTRAAASLKPYLTFGVHFGTDSVENVIMQAFHAFKQTA